MTYRQRWTATTLETPRGVRRHLIPAALVAALLTGTASQLNADTSGTIRFQRLTSEDGLPQSAVHAVAQDSAGFMWLGTQEGLVRYNGYTFTTFEHDPQDPTSLGSGWIWSLLEDRQGDLWIGTDGGGLHRFDEADGSFERVMLAPADPDAGTGDRVRVIFEDVEGQLWIGTDDGLVRLGRDRTDPLRFVHDPERPDSMASERVRSITQDTRGDIWLGTDGGRRQPTESGHRDLHPLSSRSAESRHAE